MRIITDSDGRVLDVSFGALISCGGQDGADYTGTVPTGYTSLEDWFIKEADKLYRWTVVDGELTLDSSAVAPTDKLPAADYVIEQGTSGIWTYRKWNSGYCECEGTGSATATFTNLIGTAGNYGVYEGSTVNVALPSGLFTSVNVIPIVNTRTSNGSWAENPFASTSIVTFYPINIMKKTSAIDVYFTIRVTGTWK